MTGATPMTNDTERVSDIVPVAWRVVGLAGPTHAATTSNPEIAEGWRASDLPVDPLYTANIIEAQSKALAEARVAAIEECIALLDGLTGYTGEGTEDRNDGFAMFARGVRFAKREFAKRARALVTPTPENPNG